MPAIERKQWTPFSRRNCKFHTMYLLKPKIFATRWEILDLNQRNAPFWMQRLIAVAWNQLLRKNPDVRLGCDDDDIDRIKGHRFFRKIDWKAVEARQVSPPIIPILVCALLFLTCKLLLSLTIIIIRPTRNWLRTLIASLRRSYLLSLLLTPPAHLAQATPPSSKDLAM